MARLQSLLRKFEEGRAVDMLAGRMNAKRVQALADMQTASSSSSLSWAVAPSRSRPRAVST
jgi:hypothetical protein